MFVIDLNLATYLGKTIGYENVNNEYREFHHSQALKVFNCFKLKKWRQLVFFLVLFLLVL